MSYGAGVTEAGVVSNDASPARQPEDDGLTHTTRYGIARPASPATLIPTICPANST